MSQVQVSTCLSDWIGPVYPQAIDEVNRLLNETKAYNPAKISEVVAFLKHPAFTLSATYSTDIRGFEPTEIKTFDGYIWLGGLEFKSAGYKYMVLIPRLCDRNTTDGLTLDRSIAIYVKKNPGSKTETMLVELVMALVRHLTAIFRLLSKDIWYLNRLDQIPAEGKKKIVIQIPNDHSGDAPYRKYARQIDDLIGRAPVPLGLGLISGDVSQMLQLGPEGEFMILRDHGYKVTMY